jgi:uncharacterized protein involved in exopolysaccharide biosynthesis
MRKRLDSLHNQSALREVERVSDLVYTDKTTLQEQESDRLGSANLERLELLWNHRRILAKVALYSLIISTVLAFIVPRRYKSTVSIMPPDSMNGNSSMMAALAAKTSPQLAAMATNLLGEKKTGALFAELMHSRTIQDHIVDQFHLQKVYWKRYKQDARDKLDDRTSVTEDRKSGVISLEMVDSNPERAREIAQAYVQELNLLLAQVSTSSARRERIFIEQRLATVKEDLEDAEKKFGAFASQNTALDIKEQTRAMVQSAAELQGQLIAAQSQLQGLEQIYTENNVRVRSLRAQVAELKRQLDKIGGVDASANNPTSSSDELYPSIKKLPLLGVEWADLYRRTKIQETVYELLNQQYELARIQEAKEIPTVNVIDPASYPEKRAFPQPSLLILCGTLISVLCAAAGLLVIHRWNQIDPTDPRKLLAQQAGNHIISQVRRIVRWPAIRLRKSRALDSIDEN